MLISVIGILRAAIAVEVMNANGSMRNNAYNPATIGVAKETQAVNAFVDSSRSNFMPPLALSLQYRKASQHSSRMEAYWKIR